MSLESKAQWKLQVCNQYIIISFLSFFFKCSRKKKIWRYYKFYESHRKLYISRILNHAVKKVRNKLYCCIIWSAVVSPESKSIMKITGLQAIYHNFVPRPPAKNGKGSPEKESMRRALDRKCPNRAYHLLPRKLQQSETMEFCSFLRFLFALKLKREKVDTASRWIPWWFFLGSGVIVFDRLVCVFCRVLC